MHQTSIRCGNAERLPVLPLLFQRDQGFGIISPAAADLTARSSQQFSLSVRIRFDNHHTPG